MTAGNESRSVALVRLADGAAVRLRTAEPADGARLRRMFFGLSERTRYFYFMAGVPPIEKFAERVAVLGAADGESAYALIAEAEDCVIGVARFDRAADGTTAEIGILLSDAWQSRGLGRHVLDRLADEARERAVCVFSGHVLWENTRMLRLARRASADLKLDCGWGECEILMPLYPPAQAAPATTQAEAGCPCGPTIGTGQTRDEA
ncbi:MAG TPA: GNAT family protein [Ktedonobacterales bacterium]